MWHENFIRQLDMKRKWLKRRLCRPNWHNLRSTNPISRTFGFDRGLSIGRYYIEQFIENNRHLVKGRLLEVADDNYINKFGSEVLSSDILHYTNDNPKATIIGDLTDTATLPEGQFDCFICTQTLNFIYNFQDAIKGIQYLLADGGAVLATLAGLIQISRYDMDRWGDYWRFTTLSAFKSFSSVFGEKNITVDSFGNVLSAVAILEGIASDELTKEELDVKDEDYQIIITIVARKNTQ